MRLGDKGAVDLLGVAASAWHRMERTDRFERLGKLWFMPHIGTRFSIDKHGNETSIQHCRSINNVASCNACAHH